MHLNRIRSAPIDHCAGVAYNCGADDGSGGVVVKVHRRTQKMTCIAGVVSNGKVWMGADSCYSYGDTMQVRGDRKIFTAGELIIGCSGSIRFSQVIERHFFAKAPEIPEVVKTSRDFYLWAQEAFVPNISWLAMKSEYEGAKINETGWSMLIGARGILCEINKDFSVSCDGSKFNAIGSGDFYAISSLFTTKKIFGWDSEDGFQHPRESLLLSLAAAANSVSSVCGPFVVACQPEPSPDPESRGQFQESAFYVTDSPIEEPLFPSIGPGRLDSRKYSQISRPKSVDSLDLSDIMVERRG